MFIYRIVYGHDNGLNGQGVFYAYNHTEARAKLKEARAAHDHEFNHIVPQIQPIEFNLTKGGVLDLLRNETSAFND